MAKAQDTGLKNFEKSLGELREIVSSMEKGDLGLEKSLKSFERGIELYKSCKKVLEQAEKKVKVLTEGFEEEDF